MFKKLPDVANMTSENSHMQINICFSSEGSINTQNLLAIISWFSLEINKCINKAS